MFAGSKEVGDELHVRTRLRRRLTGHRDGDDGGRVEEDGGHGGARVDDARHELVHEVGCLPIYVGYCIAGKRL
jgi:hypothetical protein